MSAELGQRGQASPVTDQLIQERLKSIEDCLSGDNAAEQSVALLSTMVGALVLARSVSDPELSQRLLKTARQQLLEQVPAG